MERRQCFPDLGIARNPVPSSKEHQNLERHVVDDGEVDPGRQQRPERRDEESKMEQQNRVDSDAKIEIPMG